MLSNKIRIANYVLVFMLHFISCVLSFNYADEREISMTADDLERMNTIADKALNQSATINELKEFNQLLIEWKELSCIDPPKGNFTNQREVK